MQQGFYVLQMTDTKVKIEAIVYGMFDPAMMKDANRAVFLTDSIAGFLVKNKDTGDPELLATRLVNSIGGLQMFNDVEYGAIMDLLVNLISEYLQ